ncbi:MAG: glycosyltransferase family protein [Elusimicrobiota bacterium]|jgi:spore coat polysaccharide biosynthesis protein SpsF (cytidylyltransferase family)
MIAAFIQARTSSSRFPGKVLKPILGRPMLSLEVERVRACRSVDRVVVVTSTAPEDQQIVKLCRNMGADVFCGSLDNVLERFYQAAMKFKPDHIVRLTGDCPLIDPAVVDGMVRLYLENGCDYGTNCVPPTYPDGLDAEIFSFKALEETKREAVLPSHIEHVTPFIESQPQRFKTVNLAYQTDLSAMRWTVDEPEDFELVRIIFETLYPRTPLFGLEDVLELFRAKPELALLNNKFMRNEGLAQSKEKDRSFSEGKPIL